MGSRQVKSNQKDLSVSCQILSLGHIPGSNLRKTEMTACKRKAEEELEVLLFLYECHLLLYNVYIYFVCQWIVLTSVTCASAFFFLKTEHISFLLKPLFLRFDFT